MNDQVDEVARCFVSPVYFADTYCQIYDATAAEWIPFKLWSEQRTTLDAIASNRLTIILKARQLGLTWLVLSYALWRAIFRPAATVLLFSRRDDEAKYLLDERLKGMFGRLPAFLRAGLVATTDSAHQWSLNNGSAAYAFPTTGGDSYTASLAIVDEADLVQDLNRLMRAVKPTIDGGGQMVLLSRADKTQPASEFKAMYRGARAGENDWKGVFLPWDVRPGRDADWYERQRRDIVARTGSVDDLHEQYPATDAEALAPMSMDKRIPAQWLLERFEERRPLARHSGPAVPGLAVYVEPRPDGDYVIGADPAEGNPTSDESALTVLDKASGEEVAALAGRIQPDTFASYVDEVGEWFNRAAVLVERNNHGHAVLLWLKDNSGLQRVVGHDGKEGWLSNSKGKALLYTTAAEAIRDGETTIHSFATYVQLASIEGSTLRAPKDMPDDRADGYALALAAATVAEPAESDVVPAVDPLEDLAF